MTHKELVAKAKDYLATIQDDYPNEYYATDRSIAASFVSDFLSYLNVKHDLKEVEQEEKKNEQ